MTVPVEAVEDHGRMLLVSAEHLKQFIQEQTKQHADELEALRSMTIDNFEIQGKHFETRISQLEETMGPQMHQTTETHTTTSTKTEKPEASSLREFAFNYERQILRGMYATAASKDPSALDEEFINVMANLKADETVAAAKRAGLVTPEPMSTAKKIALAAAGTAIGAAAIYGVARKMRSTSATVRVESPDASNGLADNTYRVSAAG